MQDLGRFMDDDINAEYDLYYGKISEVKNLLTKAYNKINPKDFIATSTSTDWMLERNDAKVSGMYHNTFLVTQNLFSEKPLLLDGFSRLFMAYDKISEKKVFFKDYSDLSDQQVMKLLAIMNFWKTTQTLLPLFDRGFCLYLYMKSGYNIKPVLDNKAEQIVGYFAKHQQLLYHYGCGDITVDEKAFFDNQRVFDDIIAMLRLYTLTASNGHPYAVQFYLILRKFRKLDATRLFPVEEFTTWLSQDKKMLELAKKLKDSYNVTSQTTIMEEAVQYAWRKYIGPTFFGEEVEMTLQEKKKKFQNDVIKAKKPYKSITFRDLTKLPTGTLVYSMIQDIKELKFEIKAPETFISFEEKIETVKTTYGSSRQESMFYFKLKDTNGKVITVKRHHNYLNDDEREYNIKMYVKK